MPQGLKTSSFQSKLYEYGFEVSFSNSNDSYNDKNVYSHSRSLKDPQTLKLAMESLAKEIVPDKDEDWHAESAYRIHLAQACLYKSILKALGEQVHPSLQASAERELHRDISSGSQSYKQNEDMWPMNKPIEKLEAKDQQIDQLEGTIRKLNSTIKLSV